MVSFWDLIGSGDKDEPFPGANLINNSINKGLVVIASSTGAILITIGGIALAVLYQKRGRSFFRSDTMIGIKRGVVVTKWIWDQLDPFLYEKGKDKPSLERARYRIDQSFDMVDNFLKSPEIIKIFKGQ